MSEKRASFTELAARDLEEATRWYRDEVSVEIAERFVERVRQAVELTVEFPGRGSSRFAYLFRPLDLRASHVEGYPYFVFYCEIEGGISIVRVLHTSRDIPRHLRDRPSD